MLGPDPNTHFPLGGEHHTVFLKNFIKNPNIEVGDFTYHHAPDGGAHFEDRCVRYHFDFIGDRLIIGRFCALAAGVEFIMNGANHAMSGFSTYPFFIFGNGWDAGFDPATLGEGNKGDTRVGNDVWIGYKASILPGVTIGDGAIVAAHSVVAADVPPFAIVAGNPAKIVRMRFPDDTIEALLEIAWWHWPAEKITRNLEAIRGSDLAALKKAR